MSTQTSSRTKVCCKCGRDVTTAKRMKDSEGRYWCVPCGETDQRRKGLAGGGICAGCGESSGATHMTEFGGMPYCDKCLKKRYRAKGSALGGMASAFSGFSLGRLLPSGGGGGESSGRMKLLLVIIAVLVLASVAYNFKLFH